MRRSFQSENYRVVFSTPGIGLHTMCSVNIGRVALARCPMLLNCERSHEGVVLRASRIRRYIG